MPKPRRPRRHAQPREEPAGLSVEILGEVSPENFDVLSGLAYVHSYLDLLSGMAQLRHEKVNFKGLRLVPGSVAFKIDVDEPILARQLAKETNEVLEGRRVVPRGLRGRVQSVRQALSRMPAGNTALVRVDDYSAKLTVSDRSESGLLYECVELRVSVYRVGGTPPRISLVSDVDGGFTLSIDRDHAEKIAKFLYREVDIVAMVARAEDGTITDGKALQFFALDDDVPEGEEAKFWRDWFAKVGSEWDEVDDIELELDRNRENSLRG